MRILLLVQILYYNRFGMMTIFVALLLIAKTGLLVAGTSVEPKLHIYPNESHIISPADKPFKLVCKGEAEYGNFLEMKWSNERGEITDNVIEKESMLELIFFTPSVEDSGVYTCEGLYESSFPRILQKKVVSAKVAFYKSNPCEFRCNGGISLVLDIKAETEDELKEKCKTTLEEIQCKINYLECEGSLASGDSTEDSSVLDFYQQNLAVYEEVCSEDTLLHAAMVDNLKCFNKMASKKIRRLCSQRIFTENRVKKAIEMLSNEGVISHADYEDESHILRTCIKRLEAKACRLQIIERKCGAIAMFAEMEILQKTDSFSKVCGKLSFSLLPEFITFLKIEDEKKHSFSRWFRKNRSSLFKSKAQKIETD